MSQKLVWTEGLFITQHHFQRLDRYHERLLADRMRLAHGYDWGVTELAVDERALAAGQLSISRLTCVLPGGAVLTGEDAIPPRPFDSEFTPQMPSLDVHVAIAQEVDGAPAVALDPAFTTVSRYARAQETFPDVNTGTSPQAVDVARPLARLLFGEERRDGFDTIKIAQLVRSPAGAVILKENYVAPVLRIAASPYLARGFRALLTAMTARQRALAESRRQRSAGAVEFDQGDLPKLWLLSTLNTYIPTIAHLVDAPAVHPEQAYLVLGQLIGQLCTMAADADPTTIPKFVYTDLGSVFEPMFARANALIGSAIQARSTAIPLTRREDGVFLGRASGPDIMRSDFFVSVSTTLPDAQVRERLPRLMKIASEHQIGAIMHSAVAGAPLELEYRPPAALPLQPGLHWFRLGRAPEFWADIVATGTFALYHPFDPNTLSLALYAVESQGK
ncbi:MAG: type VI secretion system baseplate subunit TssK [Labilithrix sp.]|nr:type VI secretion system baseplate subunit TssK [Labilithrix sp.]MCW5811450.1 type VI secretion system baseplate subunit TssK [Labilithrix sp.]